MSGQMPIRPHVTTRTQSVFGMAHDFAAQLGHAEVAALHVLLAIVREGNSPAVAVLSSFGVRLNELERELDHQMVQEGVTLVPNFAWSKGDERILEQAALEANALGHPYQGCEHVLLALLRDPASTTAVLLARHGVRFAEAQAETLRLLGSPLAGPAVGGATRAV